MAAVTTTVALSVRLMLSEPAWLVAGLTVMGSAAAIALGALTQRRSRRLRGVLQPSAPPEPQLELAANNAICMLTWIVVVHAGLVVVSVVVG